MVPWLRLGLLLNPNMCQVSQQETTGEVFSRATDPGVVNPDPDPTLEKKIRINISFDTKVYMIYMYINGIYQGLVANPGGGDTDPDPTFRRKNRIRPSNINRIRPGPDPQP